MASSTGPMGASQQLGAVPGTPSANGVLGHEGLEPENSIDGADFASSGEAEVAPRANDYDIELPEDVLDAARLADVSAREQSITNYEGAMNYVGDYGNGFTERDYAGRIGEAISAQARMEEAQVVSSHIYSHVGSNPGLPAIPQIRLRPPAILVQFPLSGRTGKRG